MVVAQARKIERARGHRPTRRTGPRAKARPKMLRAYISIFVGCLVLFAANAFLHGLVTVSSVQIRAVRQEVVRVERESQAMELEVAFLSSYPRIARDSERRLAMRAPAAGEYRIIAPEAGMATDFISPLPSPQSVGLVATVGGWLRDFGRVAASTR